MSARVHTPVPATRVGCTGTAHPPVFGVPKTSEWLAQRASRSRPWWKRLFHRDHP